MTVANTTSRNQYTATSGQTVFPYTFEIFDKGDVVVLKNGTALSEGTNYTVSGVGNDNGGNITLTVGATAGDILTIYRDMAYQRTTDYQTSGDFLAQEVNDDFDRLWLAVQQNEQANDRAIVKPITDAASIDMTLPSAADRANSYLTFDATGAPSVVAAGDPSAPDAITRQDFTGDGSTVVYTLASAPGAAGAGVMIFIDGIQQDKDSYTITGTTLTFSEAPPLNSNINLVQLKATDIGEADSASVTYIPAGTGAVQTSVQSKLRETVSVKDFGAVGDGVTDDTAAIQAAIDASSKVIVPFGYTFACKNLTLKSNFTLVVDGTLKVPDNTGSDGGDATVIKLTGANPSYDSNGYPSGFAFENITITGTGTIDGNCGNLPDRFNSGGTVQFYGHAVTITSTNNFVVEKVNIIDASGFALAINQCKDVMVRGCKILTGPHREGNSNFFNGRNQDGLHTVNSHNVIIDGNFIESGDDAINIEATDASIANASSKNIVITSNKLRQHMGTGNRDGSSNDYRITAFNFKVDPVNDASVESVLFANNDIDGSNGGAKAISIGAGSANDRLAKQIKVVNNNITEFNNLGATGNVPDLLIRFRQVNGVEFSGNKIHNFARQIQIENVEHLEIRQNVIKNQSANATGNPNNYLFNIDRSSNIADEITISQNTFDRLLGGCVIATNSSNSLNRFRFTDNTIVDCANGNTSDSNNVTYSVINIKTPDECEFSRNSIYDHAASCFIATSMDSNSRVRCLNNYIFDLGNSQSAINAELFSIKEDLGTTVNGEVTLIGNVLDNSGGLAVELQNIKRVFILNNQFNSSDQKNDINVMYLLYKGTSSNLVTTGVEGVISNNAGSNDTALTSGAIRIRTEQLDSSSWNGAVFKVQFNHFSNASSGLTYQGGTNGEATAANVVSEDVPTSPSSTNTLIA